MLGREDQDLEHGHRIERGPFTIAAIAIPQALHQPRKYSKSTACSKTSSGSPCWLRASRSSFRPNSECGSMTTLHDWATSVIHDRKTRDGFADVQLTRRSGWSPKGNAIPAMLRSEAGTDKPSSSVCAAMSLSLLGSSNKGRFELYVETQLAPTLSPRSPIEMALSKLKTLLRKHAARSCDALKDICDLFEPNQCRSFFKAALEFVFIEANAPGGRVPRR